MKLSARYHFLIFVVLTTYLLLNINFAPKPPTSLGGHRKNTTKNHNNGDNIGTRSNKDHRNNHINNLIESYYRSTSNYKNSNLIQRKNNIKSNNIISGNRRKIVLTKSQKSLIMERLRNLITNYTPSEPKTKDRKKPVKPTPNNNYRLSRLLFQLWDPNSNANQGAMMNCDNLVSLDKKKYHQGRRFARKLNRKFYEYVNVSDIWDAVKDSCTSVKNVFKYKAPKFGPESYPLAYTVTFDRTAEQSLRMLSSIYHHENVYCIHPNARFGMLFVNVFKRISECIPNIILPEKIYEIRVKTFHHLKAELACFGKLLNSTVPWKYGINLPSSAFPLRNNSYIVHYLKHKPYESVISWSFPHTRFIRRIKYVHVVRESEGETLLMRTSTMKKPPPDSLVIFRKGNFIISTREFYHFLTESDISKRLLAWAQDTKTPEDFYYSTLYRHKQAPGGLPYDPGDTEPPEKMVQTLDTENVIDTPLNDLLVTLWKSDTAHRCHGQYRGHVCIFSAADLRWLIEQDNLFALSFDFRVDRVAIDCLSKNLKEPILPETRTDINGLPPVII